MSKVTLEGFIIIPKEDMATVMRELPEHIALTRKEPGCLLFNVTQDQHNMAQLNVYEEYASPAAFEQHQLRVKSSKWGDMTKHIKRHYKIDGL